MDADSSTVMTRGAGALGERGGREMRSYLASPRAMVVALVAVVLAIGALAFDRGGGREGTELMTAAGVAGLLAGITGLLTLATQFVASSIASALGAEPDLSGAQQHQEWDVFLLVVALLLIWYGLRAAWRAAALVFGLVLIPFTLFQLIDMLGGNPDKSGHNAWVFAVAAVAGWYAAFVHGLRWGALFGGLALIISWMAFWSLGRDNGNCPGQTTARADCSGLSQAAYDFTSRFRAFP